MSPLYYAVGASCRLRQIVLSDAALRHKAHNCLVSPHRNMLRRGPHYFTSWSDGRN